MTKLTADDIRQILNLSHNDAEGGYLAPVYQASLRAPNSILDGFPAVEPARALCDAIYYFLDGKEVSILHRVKGDMLYHLYIGGPVEMFMLHPDSDGPAAETVVLGTNLGTGMQPVRSVPGGSWLGSRLIGDADYALMGVSMAPGFNPADYEIADRAALSAAFPDHEDLIDTFTRP